MPVRQVVSLGLCLLAACGGSAAPSAEVTVARGTVVRRAIATGFVEPFREAQVNTQLGGFVRHVHVRLGQKVEAGAALVEVWPALTEQDVLRAERSLQAAIEGEQAAQEFVEGEHVLASVTRFLQGERNLGRMKQAAERGRRSAEETLELLRKGEVVIDGRKIDFAVRAPVAGHVLEVARTGDPVTPRSSYGIGTVVAVLGDLDRPVFRGTVDEIDVDRLREGMAAAVVLGALPDAQLRGKVVEIGLRARRQDGASRFDVRIEVERPAEGVALRAGFSAVAEVELARAEQVLVVPERVLRFDGRRPYVLVRGGGAAPERRAIETGLGDGLLVEVRTGLAEGERVLEPQGVSR